MYRLSNAEIAEYRERLLKEQNNVCPLCENHIEPDEAVLDHDHDTGLVRAVLHRSCNGSEGRILTFASTRCRSDDPKLFIRNLMKYWDADYGENPFHPQHQIPEEIERLALKRKLRHLKRQSTIDATKARIKELNEIIKLKTQR